MIPFAIVAAVYGGSVLALRHALAWFIRDTRTNIPGRLGRAIVVAVIFTGTPFLLLAALGNRAMDRIRHWRLQRQIRRLPRADAEQIHVVDEIQHPDFYDHVHHPAGNLGGTR